jgi:cytoskeleton protein RodZ
METLGQKLRKEREMRGISLDQIAQATRIQKQFLRALEENNFDILPAPVFITGFLRVYATHLGLDADAIITEYEAGRLSHQSDDTSHPQSTTPPDGKNLPLVAAAVIAVIILVVVVSFMYRPTVQRPIKTVVEEDLVPPPQAEIPASSPPVEEHPKSIPEAAPPAVALLRETANAEAEKRIKGEPASEQSKPATSAKPKAEEKPVTSAKPKVEEKPAEIAPKAKSSYTYNLSLTSTDEDVWVYVVVDGEDVRDMYIRAGQSVFLRGNKTFLLTTGNPHFLRLKVNGRSVSIPEAESNKVIRNWKIPLGAETDAG